MDFGVGNRPLGVKTNQGIAHRFRPGERLRCVKTTGSYPRGVSANS
jgi:hypothetical protein